MQNNILEKCSVGFLQFDVKLGQPEANLAQVEEGLQRLAPTGPGIIVLPEMWSCGFAYERLQQLACLSSEHLDFLQQLAKKYGIYLAGSLPEEVITEIDSAVYNTLYVVGLEGVVGSYRKQQLFAPMAEDEHFSSGDDPQPIKTELGCLATLVCFDLRFPDLAQAQIAQGAALLLVSAQWPALRREQWRTLLMARAIENQAYVVACNRCGITGDIEFGGSSMVIGPDGRVLVEAGITETAAEEKIDPLLLTEIRSRFNTIGPRPYRFHDQKKIMDLAELQPLVDRYKALGRKVVFTNGCFDILHEGHVTYLEAARKEGDCLVVGLNSDSSVRRLGKGNDRPLNREQSRARLLAALGCVDYVVLFGDDTPQRLIATLLPDVVCNH